MPRFFIVTANASSFTFANLIFTVVIDRKQEIQQEERAVIVGVILKDQTELQVQEYLDELSFLAETAGAITIKRFFQKLSHPDSKTFVGMYRKKIFPW
jgi:hypothetical protein